MAGLQDVYNGVVEIIQAAGTIADEKIAEATSYTQDAIAAVENSTYLASLSVIIPAPNFPEVPELDTSDDYDALYTTRRNQAWEGLEVWLQEVMEGWMAQYAPKLDACIQPNSDAWLCGVLGEGRLGIPAALEAQIWDRARAREVQEAMRLEQESFDTFASRGFSLPPGALAARALAVQMDGTTKSATLNRDVAIKQAEISVDVSKHAIEITTRLRIGVAQALADFFRAALAIPQQASEDARNIVQAQAALQQQIESLVRTRVAVCDIELKHKIAQAESDIRAADIVSTERVNRYKAVADASMAAAKTAADIAAAAIHAQQTLGVVGYEGTETNAST